MVRSEIVSEADVMIKKPINRPGGLQNFTETYFLVIE